MKFIISLILFTVSLSLKGQFCDVEVVNKNPLDDGFFTVDFAFEDIIPGDLIELKEKGSPHKRHIYSPTRFPTKDDPTFQITSIPRNRAIYETLSKKLFNAKIGKKFQIKILKTTLSEALTLRPVLIIAGGFAITRAIGLAKYLESINHDFLIIHSKNEEKSAHNDYLISLKEKNFYTEYITSEGILHINESIDNIPSFLDLYFEKYQTEANYILCGPDASIDNQGNFESNITEKLINMGIDDKQIFGSTWQED